MNLRFDRCVLKLRISPKHIDQVSGMICLWGTILFIYCLCERSFVQEKTVPVPLGHPVHFTTVFLVGM